MAFLNSPAGLILFGVVVGVFSGVMGLGGGSVMIPIMVLVYGLTQTQAHGTSLAVMVPPVALPAVIVYWRTVNADGSRNVNLAMAAWMALGVTLGTYFGGYIANWLPKETLKLVFGFLLIYVAGYTVFGKENLARTTILSGGLVVIAMIIWLAVRWWGHSQPA